MIELVVFDLAGTTVYDGDAVNASFRAALAAVGLDADPAAVKLVMGLPKPVAIRQLLTEAGRAFTPQAIDAIHDDFVTRMKHYYATDPSVREVPGATATFSILRQGGIKVAVDTGFNRAVTAVLLARLGWNEPEVIDASVTSDEVPRGRPFPDMVRQLMARLNVDDPKKVAKIGDTAADLEEGHNAECGLVIGVTSGSFTREQLQTYPHTHILESVAELPGLLSKLRGGDRRE